jgi:thioredoxin 1
VSALARERSGQLKVVRVDGGESPDLVASLGVRGLPTFVLFQAGRETRRQAGFSGARSIRALLDD